MRRAWPFLGLILISGGLLLAGCNTLGAPPEAGTLLQLVNQARSAPRTCGGTAFAAAPPLALAARLTRAAQLHSQDMQATGDVSHTGSDGSTLQNRIDAQGSTWARIGENIAWGYTTMQQVVQAWLNSPGHCANIMDARFQDLGTGVAGTYWTLDFGTPR